MAKSNVQENIGITGGPHVFIVRTNGEIIGEVWNCRQNSAPFGNLVWYCTGGFLEALQIHHQSSGIFHSREEAVDFLVENHPKFPMTFEGMK